MCESLLYHLFYRKDHRRNYFMHWYWTYLLLEREESINDVNMITIRIIAIYSLKLLLTTPPIIIFLTLSAGLAPYDICITLFTQTYLFVCWNKACTGQ